jgi:putative transposase
MHDLILRQKQSVPKTTNSAHNLREYSNLLLELTLTAPQQAWVCDITYLCIGLVFGYLSSLTDAYSKLIVGYCLHLLPTMEGSLKALEMALQNKQPENAVAERVNGILKTDFCLNRVFATFDEAARALEQSVRR